MDNQIEAIESTLKSRSQGRTRSNNENTRIKRATALTALGLSRTTLRRILPLDRL